MQYPSWDQTITENLRRSFSQGVVLRIAKVLAHSGDSWLWCGGLFFLWVFSEGETERTLVFWAGAIGFTALFVFFLKKLIARKRPDGDWGEVYRKGDPYSFPSGHAVRAGLITVLAFGTFGFSFVSFLFTLWAIFMSLSRVVTGLHYVFDISFGFLLGIVLGAAWLNFQPWIYESFSIFFDRSLWFS